MTYTGSWEFIDEVAIDLIFWVALSTSLSLDGLICDGRRWIDENLKEKSEDV